MAYLLIKSSSDETLAPLETIKPADSRRFLQLEHQFTRYVYSFFIRNPFVG